MDWVKGGLAAVSAAFCTNPLEVVKIRMQLQGELLAKGNYSVHYRNVFHAAYTIARVEGIQALQKGLGPALCFQFVMNGTRLGTYRFADKQGFTRNKSGKVHLLKSAMVGSMCGCVGSSIATPLYLVKTQLQSRANVKTIAVGHQHSHTNMFKALHSIYVEHGAVGLCRGLTSTFPRTMVASAVQLSTFEKCVELIRSKQYFSRESMMNPFIASLISGFFVSFAMAPFDIISTRFYNQAVDSKGKGMTYSSIFDCGTKILKKERLFGFWKGWSANYFRIGPHTLLSLMFWDKLKNIDLLNPFQPTKTGKNY